jgi:hypothetical protein
MAFGITVLAEYLSFAPRLPCPSPGDVHIEATRGNPGYTSGLIDSDKVAGRDYTLKGGNPRAGCLSPPLMLHWALGTFCHSGFVSGGLQGYVKFHFQPQLYFTTPVSMGFVFVLPLDYLSPPSFVLIDLCVMAAPRQARWCWVRLINPFGISHGLVDRSRDVFNVLSSVHPVVTFLQQR